VRKRGKNRISKKSNTNGGKEGRKIEGKRKIVMSRIQHCFLVSCDEVQRDIERHVQSAMLLLLVTSLTYQIEAACGVIQTHSMIQVNSKKKKGNTKYPHGKTKYSHLLRFMINATKRD
jgi:hypothetical protein